MKALQKVGRVIRLIVFLFLGLFVSYIVKKDLPATNVSGALIFILNNAAEIISFKAGIILTLHNIRLHYEVIFITLSIAIISDAAFVQWVLPKLSNNLKSVFEDGSKCVLFDAPWGSGKTHYYKHILKPQFNSEPVYISCFSATKDELITQLMIANPIFNLLSLNGIFSGLMKNNWRSFLPQNKIVVFDDMERLHKSNDDSYRDLIGIISFLVIDNKCKVLLICNREELNSDIFNQYLEKVIDKEVNFDIEKNIQIALDGFNKKYNKTDEHYEQLTQQLITISKNTKLYNIRILESAWRILINDYDRNINILNESNSTDKMLLSSFYRSFEGAIILAVQYNHLYYANNKLYHNLINDEINDNDELKKYGLRVENYTTDYLYLQKNNVMQFYLEQKLSFNSFLIYEVVLNTSVYLQNYFSFQEEFDFKNIKLLDLRTIEAKNRLLTRIGVQDIELFRNNISIKSLGELINPIKLKELSFKYAPKDEILTSIIFNVDYFKKVIAELNVSNDLTRDSLHSLGVLFAKLKRQDLLDIMVSFLIQKSANIPLLKYATFILHWFIEGDKTIPEIKNDFHRSFNEYVLFYFKKIKSSQSNLVVKYNLLVDLYKTYSMKINFEWEIEYEILDVIIKHPELCEEILRYYIYKTDIVTDSLPWWVICYIDEYSNENHVVRECLQSISSKADIEIYKQFRNHYLNKIQILLANMRTTRSIEEDETNLSN